MQLQLGLLLQRLVYMLPHSVLTVALLGQAAWELVLMQQLQVLTPLPLALVRML